MPRNAQQMPSVFPKLASNQRARCGWYRDARERTCDALRGCTPKPADAVRKPKARNKCQAFFLRLHPTAERPAISDHMHAGVAGRKPKAQRRSSSRSRGRESGDLAAGAQRSTEEAPESEVANQETSLPGRRGAQKKQPKARSRIRRSRCRGAAGHRRGSRKRGRESGDLAAGAQSVFSRSAHALPLSSRVSPQRFRLAIPRRSQNADLRR